MRAVLTWLAALLLVLPMNAEAQSQSQALLDAAERGDLPGVERLLAAGAPIDATDAAKQTPLLLAVRNNHLAIATRLIDAGASINAQAACPASGPLIQI